MTNYDTYIGNKWESIKLRGNKLWINQTTVCTKVTITLHSGRHCLLITHRLS